MPELPEVQTIVEDLKQHGLVGRVIESVQTDWPRMLQSGSLEYFRDKIEGARIANIWRRGKFIIVGLGEWNLLIHLRMSGRLDLIESSVAKSRHEHLLLGLDDRRDLRMHDTRKFGRVFLVEDVDEILNPLGPEPLERSFRLNVFRKELLRRKRALKPLLLDQHFIAGLGNIYVDEALWDAGIHPARKSCDLSENEIRALRRAIPKVLRRGIKNKGTSLGDGRGNYTSISGRRGRNRTALKAYGRAGQPCKRCGTPIERIVVAQRSTHFCPSCQPVV